MSTLLTLYIYPCCIDIPRTALSPFCPAAVVISPDLWFLALLIAVNPVLQVGWWPLSLTVLVMEGFEQVRRPLEVFCIVELGLVVEAYLLGLVLEPSLPHPTLANVFNLPLRMLVIYNWQW